MDNEKYNNLINVVEKAGVNIEEISLLILTDFKIKSEIASRKFDKVARKEKKRILNFVEKNIVPFWINYVESKNEEIRDVRNILDKEVFLSYLSGIYISIHSKKIENIDFFIKSTLAEMFHKTAIKIQNR